MKLWFKLEASLEVCNVSHTQQVCNRDDQNMGEVTQVLLQCGTQDSSSIVLLVSHHQQ